MNAQPALKEFYRHFKSIQSTINHKLSKGITFFNPPNLYKPIQYALNLKGKRLRPVLLILSGEAVGGTKNDCFDAALAIEMLHSFTLVHDDIMDDDAYRRGKLTIHTKWDNNVAILAGDALIALAYQALLRTSSSHLSQITQIFSQGILEVCEGQSLDKDFESLKNVSLRQYIHMIGLKTGALMGISAQIGGIIGNGNPDQVQALKEYGFAVGVAFQIQDDLLDIIAEKDVWGKDLGSDLCQGKKTYPLLLLRERISAADNKTVKRILNQHSVSSRDVKQIKNLLQQYNIVIDASKEVHRRIQFADRMLNKISGSFDKSNLIEFSQLIEGRMN
ncbi:MAG: polyprenyl synthetase family protein [Patescibacteria group bacterium]|nr:polyprenyl synthetase family protein [Patescibacteria group bacterium]